MIKITSYGHSCFKIENENLSIVIDPFYDDSVPGLVFPNNVTAHYVFISHQHRDHAAREYINIVKTNKTIKYEEYLLPHDHEKGCKRGMVYGRIFYFDRLSFAHLGDIGDISDPSILKPFMNVDVLFVPINGTFTISSQEAKKLVDICHPRLVIPMHYENKVLGTGYPDDHQIEIFKTLFPNYLEVKNNTVIVDEHLFSYRALIFENE